MKIYVQEKSVKYFYAAFIMSNNSENSEEDVKGNRAMSALPRIIDGSCPFVQTDDTAQSVKEVLHGATSKPSGCKRKAFGADMPTLELPQQHKAARPTACRWVRKLKDACKLS